MLDFPPLTSRDNHMNRASGSNHHYTSRANDLWPMLQDNQSRLGFRPKIFKNLPYIIKTAILTKAKKYPLRSSFSEIMRISPVFLLTRIKAGPKNATKRVTSMRKLSL